MEKKKSLPAPTRAAPLVNRDSSENQGDAGSNARAMANIDRSASVNTSDSEEIVGLRQGKQGAAASVATSVVASVVLGATPLLRVKAPEASAEGKPAQHPSLSGSLPANFGATNSGDGGVARPTRTSNFRRPSAGNYVSQKLRLEAAGPSGLSSKLLSLSSLEETLCDSPSTQGLVSPRSGLVSPRSGGGPCSVAMHAPQSAPASTSITSHTPHGLSQEYRWPREREPPPPPPVPEFTSSDDDDATSESEESSVSVADPQSRRISMSLANIVNARTTSGQFERHSVDHDIPMPPPTLDSEDTPGPPPPDHQAPGPPPDHPLHEEGGPPPDHLPHHEADDSLTPAGPSPSNRAGMGGSDGGDFKWRNSMGSGRRQRAIHAHKEKDASAFPPPPHALTHLQYHETPPPPPADRGPPPDDRGPPTADGVPATPKASSTPKGVALEHVNTHVFEAILLKKGKVKGYQKRYTVLFCNRICMFKPKNASSMDKPTTQIALTADVHTETSEKDNKTGIFPFTLITSEKQYILATTTTEERDAWIRAIDIQCSLTRAAAAFASQVPKLGVPAEGTASDLSSHASFLDSEVDALTSAIDSEVIVRRMTIRNKFGGGGSVVDMASEDAMDEFFQTPAFTNCKIIDTLSQGGLASLVDSIPSSDERELMGVVPLLFQVLLSSPFWVQRTVEQIIEAFVKKCPSYPMLTQQIQFFRMSKYFQDPILDVIAPANKGLRLKMERLTELLKAITEDKAITARTDVPLPEPMLHPFRVGVTAKKLKILAVFKTNARPILADFITFDQKQMDVLISEGIEHSVKPEQLEAESGSPIIIKKGDDLRQDLACLHIFKVFNQIWRQNKLEYNGIPIHCREYGVLPLTEDLGIIEYVAGCASMTTLGKIKKNNPRWISRLVASAVGAFIGGYILGIRDRHSDNIIVEKQTGNLFQIDFGHILGDSVAIDTGEFAITPAFKDALGAEAWGDFCNLCCKAFEAIRKSNKVAIQYCELLLEPLMEKGKVSAGSFLRKSLMLDDNAASAKLKAMIERAPSNYRTRFKNLLHGVATTMK